MAKLNPYESQLTNGAATVSGTVMLRSFNSSRQSITLQNLGTGRLYAGGSTVSTANGIVVYVDGDITLDRSGGAAVYCTATGTTSIRFIEEVI